MMIYYNYRDKLPLTLEDMQLRLLRGELIAHPCCRLNKVILTKTDTEFTGLDMKKLNEVNFETI